MNRVRLALLCAVLLLSAVPASALTVAVVRPPVPSAAATETLVRLQGELQWIGFEVKIVDSPAAHGRGATSSSAWLEELAAGPEIDAVIDIVNDAGQVVVQVWVADRAPRKYVILKVALEPNAENASERLAIRAVEVLRSSLLETSLATRERRGDPAAPTKAVTPPSREKDKPSSYAEHLGLEVGAAALTSLDRVGPAILPLVRFDWAIPSWLVMQATLAGQGTRPTVATTAGDALVAQEYGLLGARYHFRSDAWFWPFFALSAGFLRTSVEGHADVPKQGHSSSQWSFLWEGSLGAGLSLGARYYLTMAVHVHVAEPHIAIHFVDETVATSARPNLLLTFTLGAWL